MKKMRIGLSLFVLFSGLTAHAQNYLVMFRQTEMPVTPLEHGDYQNLLQGANKKNLAQLQGWLGRSSADAALKDLWLIRGAALNLSTDAAAKLKKEPWVRGVYESKLRKFISQENTKVGNTIKDLGADSGNLWGMQNLGLPQTVAQWPQLTGKGVRIGSIDTGIQAHHPEFAAVSGITFKDFVNGMSNPYDDAGHGTHTAGTIAGVNVGLAPQASLIIAKAFNAKGAATDDALIGAMQWMFDPDGDPTTNDFPQVVNNSWGADLAGPNGVFDIAQFAPYEAALQAWIQGGIVPVFAAGNSTSSPNGMPGGLPEPLAVGALNPDATVAPFSSTGPNLWLTNGMILTLLKPDVSAPGVGIVSAYPGNKYASMDGTSMATPHVTGCVALLLQMFPTLSYANVKAMLLASSNQTLDVSSGYGQVNLYNLIQYATTPQTKNKHTL
jgi:subtilisin family serine protease